MCDHSNECYWAVILCGTITLNTPQSVTIKIKAIEQYFDVVVFVLPFNMVSLFKYASQTLVQFLNSPFFPPHVGAEPGRAKEVQTTINHIFYVCYDNINVKENVFFQSASWERHCATQWREQRGWDVVIFDWFVLSMRMQVILDSSFVRPGSAPIWGERRVQGLIYSNP